VVHGVQEALTALPSMAPSASAATLDVAAPDAAQAPPAPERAGSRSMVEILTAFYDAWEAGDVPRALACLAEDVRWTDKNFAPFLGVREAERFIRSSAVLGQGVAFVVTGWAEDVTRRKVGVTWELRGASGELLPIAALGTSLVTFDENRSLIVEMLDHAQPLAPLPGELQLPLGALVSRLVEAKREGAVRLPGGMVLPLPDLQ